MSAILSSYRYAQKRKEEMNKAKKKQQEKKAQAARPTPHQLQFVKEYSEWSFSYGPPGGQDVVYAVRIYRDVADRALFVNGVQYREDDYKVEEYHDGRVIKVYFRVGKYKCQIISSVREIPDDQNQTLIFNGDRIQFVDETEAE